MIEKKLEEDFYLQSCLAAAKEMIGMVLVRKKGKQIYSGIIVETEAYLGNRDAASHSFNGKTKRNEHMFGRGGTAYVYFTYGNHYCVNAVIGKPCLLYTSLLNRWIYTCRHRCSGYVPSFASNYDILFTGGMVFRKEL